MIPLSLNNIIGSHVKLILSRGAASRRRLSRCWGSDKALTLSSFHFRCYGWKLFVTTFKSLFTLICTTSKIAAKSLAEKKSLRVSRTIDFGLHPSCSYSTYGNAQNVSLHVLPIIHSCCLTSYTSRWLPWPTCLHSWGLTIPVISSDPDLHTDHFYIPVLLFDDLCYIPISIRCHLLRDHWVTMLNRVSLLYG